MIFFTFSIFTYIYVAPIKSEVAIAILKSIAENTVQSQMIFGSVRKKIW